MGLPYLHIRIIIAVEHGDGEGRGVRKPGERAQTEIVSLAHYRARRIGQRERIVIVGGGERNEIHAVGTVVIRNGVAVLLRRRIGDGERDGIARVFDSVTGARRGARRTYDRTRRVARRNIHLRSCEVYFRKVTGGKIFDTGAADRFEINGGLSGIFDGKRIAVAGTLHQSKLVGKVESVVIIGSGKHRLRGKGIRDFTARPAADGILRGRGAARNGGGHGEFGSRHIETHAHVRLRILIDPGKIGGNYREASVVGKYAAVLAGNDGFRVIAESAVAVVGGLVDERHGIVAFELVIKSRVVVSAAVVGHDHRDPRRRPNGIVGAEIVIGKSGAAHIGSSYAVHGVVA